MATSNALKTVTWISVGLVAIPAVLVVAVIYYSARDTAGPAPAATSSVQPAPAVPESPYAKLMASIPKGPEGDAIRRGRDILEHTYETLPANVGNSLHCTSCHLDGGTVAGAGPWIGLAAVFPEYRSRSAKVDSLDRRINDCFERSLNGKALDPAGPDMAAILAYMNFISRDAPGGKPPPGRGFKRIEPPLTPDRAAGQQKYATKCASCHGPDGAGVYADGKYTFPALWGDRSYNIGAGMARLDTAAAFIRANMPRGAGGTIAEQDSYDIADFVIHQPRPDFAGKVNDWPKGGKPRDARY